LQSHKEAWEQKPVLKKLYTHWYKEILQQFKPEGICLEIGGGTGNFKEFYPNTICTDIVNLPWLDLITTAEKLPFKKHSFDNIILFDVLHHIENPYYFFSEALRVLKTNGRLIMMEPFISVLSWPVYHFLHPEPVNFNSSPLEIVPAQKNRQPFDSNQATANQLFYNKRSQFQKNFPQFEIVHKKQSEVDPKSRTIVSRFKVYRFLFL